MTRFPSIDPDFFTPARFAGLTMPITGAGSGMGEACALRAAREGARLVLADIDAVAAATVVEKVRAAGGSAVSAGVDITSRADCDRMLEVAVEAYGGLDIAINNAGVMDGGDDGRPAPVHLASETYLRQTVEVNLMGPIYACAAELKQMVAQERGGAIVNVGSFTALTGSPGTPAYVASKHGISGLTRAIAIDYALHGIRCNSVNMAVTETPMYERALEFVRSRMSAADAGAMAKRPGKAGGLMPRNATVWEQAAVILFAASREASNMTGALLASDGGWTAF
jgi:NAD(P)-dependent dehydrogenase (short-subunit alcohol dehydrogenase family)